MKEKNINLFDKAIHTVKKTMADIVKERERYHTKLNRFMHNIELLRNSHNNKMNELLEEQQEVLDELQELFEDLYEENGG